MKRIAAFAMMIVLMLTMASCSKDPKTAVIEANNKTAALACQEIKGEAAMTIMDMTFKIPMEAKITMEEGMPKDMYMKMSVMGMDMEMTVVDNVQYMKMSGMGTENKTKVEVPEIEDQQLEGAYKELYDKMLEYTKSMDYTKLIATAERKGSENGLEEYALTFDMEVMKGYVDDAMNMMMDAVKEELGEELGDSMDDVSFSFDDLGITFEIPEYTLWIDSAGYASAYDMTISMAVDTAKLMGEVSGGEAVPETGAEQQAPFELSISMNIEYVNPGATFEITLPADADQYEDMGSMVEPDTMGIIGGADGPTEIMVAA